MHIGICTRFGHKLYLPVTVDYGLLFTSKNTKQEEVTVEKQKKQFYCPISSLETGRIHPASFYVGYGLTNELIQHRGKIYCIVIGFHKQGFHEPNAAMQWISRNNENNLEILAGMTIRGCLKVERCIPFPEEVILEILATA